MYRNQQEPEGAFCVVSGNGDRFYGDTRQQAYDAMMADAAMSAKTLARFGKYYLPADFAESLPALPDGYEYLVLERMRYEATGHYNDHGDENYEPVPYEHRAFAVPRVTEAVAGNAAIAWRSGKPRRTQACYRGGYQSEMPWTTVIVPDDRHSGLRGNVGQGPAIARHLDVAYRTDEIALLPGSLEFADGAWVPRTAIDLPYRDGNGGMPLAPPNGYGRVLVTDTGDDGLSDYTRHFALPFGEQTLFCDDFRHRKIVLATVTVTAEPTCMRKGECFRNGNPTMPPGTMELRDGTWIAYDRDACDRWDAEERAKPPGGGWGSRPAGAP